MNWPWPLSLLIGGSNEKVWEVGEHRVKAKAVPIPGTELQGDWQGHTARRERRYYCIDCDKEAKTREELEEERCYRLLEDEEVTVYERGSKDA